MLTEKQIKKLQRNQKYWGNRLEEIQEEIQNSNGIKNVYRKAYAQMEKELLALHSEVIKNEGKITRTQLYRLKHYKELMRQIREMSKTVSTDVNSAIFETLENAYTQTFTELAEVIDASDFDLVDKKQASSIVNTKFYGEHFSDRVWANTNAIASRMKNDIIDACIKGVSRDRLVKAIKNDFDVAFYKADRIVRTETMRVLNQASLEKYKEFGATKVKWLTSSGACDICRKFKDKIFDIDDVPPIAHPNCKCTQIPIIDDEVSENTANNTTKCCDTIDG